MAAEGQREKALAWAAAATGGALAAAGVYWAGKKALDYYVPYQVCLSCMLALLLLLSGSLHSPACCFWSHAEHTTPYMCLCVRYSWLPSMLLLSAVPLQAWHCQWLVSTPAG